MQHNITIIRSTTSTRTSAISINTRYLKSLPGLLKTFQMILGAVVVGIVGYFYDDNTLFCFNYKADTFFLIISVTFLIGTFLLWVSCLISTSTATVISETLYEVMYHGFAFVLYLAATITFLIKTKDRPYNSYSYINDAYMAAAIIGFLVTVLYGVGALYPERINIRRVMNR